MKQRFFFNSIPKNIGTQVQTPGNKRNVISFYRLSKAYFAAARLLRHRKLFEAHYFVKASRNKSTVMFYNIGNLI
jgi:hypothetical protein